MRELEDRRSNRNPALKSLVDLVIAAFDGDPHQSLSANLRRLKEDDWTAIPNGGQRTISDILEHVGWAKWMYEDYAFGSATLRGDLPPVAAPEGGRLDRRKPRHSAPRGRIAQRPRRPPDRARLPRGRNARATDHKLGSAIANTHDHPNHDWPRLLSRRRNQSHTQSPSWG